MQNAISEEVATTKRMTSLCSVDFVVSLYTRAAMELKKSQMVNGSASHDLSLARRREET
jgi:hypothetical protein